MKRKQWIIIAGLLLVAVVAIVIMMRVIASRAEDAPELVQHDPYTVERTQVATSNIDPTSAVVGLMCALRDWDMGLAAQWMSTLPEGVFADSYHGIIAPTIERIEFDTGAEKIVGDTAMVDISVTAVDLGAALGDLTADAAGYLLGCTVSQTEPVWPDFLLGYVNTMDIGEMLRVKRTATVHLVRDSSGKWRVDLQSAENRSFLNAVTGGLPDIIEALGEVKAVL